ncbi:MAG: ferrochelatase [Alphaproteobacteria bacterium]|nr:ferrochelatase [Alphaproteobacteria bacterium]
MKIAVVLYNLGGPDRPEDVQPFLFNLFNDPMIIAAPGPIRWLLARVISKRRVPIARDIYKHLGGGSPLLANTEAQSAALQTVLAGSGDDEYRTFVAMRYWHPQADAVARDVKAYGPDKIVLLPLYPQYSTTTIGSFMRVWEKAIRSVGLNCPTSSICCYPTEPGFISATVEAVRAALQQAGTGRPVRILFSAHGLPKKIVEDGDPYQWQVEQTAKAVVDELAIDGLDWLNCYQSRVGPLEWIAPATEDEIRRAGADGVAVVIVPLAFVSEHSETLVELDIEYRHVAAAAGVVGYHRTPTVSVADTFIAGLARLVSVALSDTPSPCSGSVDRICPQSWSQCLCAVEGAVGRAG